MRKLAGSIANDRIAGQSVTGNRTGDQIARRLLPAAIGLTIALGFLRLMGERAGLYSTEVGTTLFAASNIVIFVFLILRISKFLNKVEAERVLIQQELDRLFEISVDPMCIAGFDGYFKRVNPAWQKVLGFSRQELLSRPYLEFIHPQDLAATVAEAENIEKGKTTLSFENRYRCNDGSYKWFQWNAIPFSEEQLIYAVVRDVTSQKQRETEIRRLNEELEQQRVQTKKSLEDLQHRYELILQSAGEGIYGVDADGRTTFVNTAAAALLGYDTKELIGQYIHRMVHHSYPDGRAYPAKDCPIYSAFRIGNVHRETNEVFWRKDGTSFPVEYVSTPVQENGKPVGAVVIFRDITALKNAEANRIRAEEQLRHSQKIEAIGQLAGGVAHDFNNILMAILGYCDLLSIKLDSSSFKHREVEEISKAAQRGADLTRQLLAFSRKQILEAKIVDLNSVLENMKGMLRRLIPESIELEIRKSENLDFINADPGQIEQVIMNLVVNARDAMPSGGKITIETDNEYLDEFYAKQHLAVTPGSYVRIVISDTGYGMDENTRARIFEPFFTTKEQGKGTGLGLSTVYGIVKQLGGDIWVYSEIGMGSIFRIYLPRSEEAIEKTEIAASAVSDDVLYSGSELILLVDDNESVRTALTALLEAHGYTVIQAANGSEALKLAADYPDIKLLITDMVMPEMGGAELANQLRRRFQSVKVLFLSGYTEETAFQGEQAIQGTAYLNKPVSMSTLLLKIRELVAERPRVSEENTSAGFHVISDQTNEPSRRTR